jgi:hypothetical protein
VCLVLGILNLVFQSDWNDKKNKKSVSQSAQGVVGEDSNPASQKENEASKEGGNTSQVGNVKSGSTSLGEKGNSADTKNKISRKVAPYASGAGAWAVNTATKEQKKTYKMVSQIDPRSSISEILGSSDLSDPATRAVVSAYMADREEARYQFVLAKANQMGVPVRINGPGHNVSILYDIRQEGPLYRKTLNTNAAISTGANLLNQTPYGLNGEGMTVGVWDAARARTNHVELAGKVTVGDSTTANDDHSTHVAGTIAAKGVDPKAKGMGTNTLIRTYDWNTDYAEMTAIGAATATQGATKIPLSNHSYGYNATAADMGRYETECNTVDALALGLPYYLVFWAAGNEQDTLNTVGNGYQSITFNGLAKNILTVGAGDDAVTGGVRDVSKGTLAYFSSMGPCDDGRIKPDIVANGVNVYSCIASNNNTSYDGTYSGTSMATPNACGSAALLEQLYKSNFSGQIMRASMLKALLIHTADDVGRLGPDYQYGWGYMNAKAAADVILAHKASLAQPKMIEDSITAATKTRTTSFVWDGSSPIRATVVWTDPAGAAQTATNSRTRNLINDLDLKITAPNGTTTYLPYVMPFVGVWTTNSMTNNAVTGTNKVDNVERVDIPAPTQPGTYTVTVGMYGTNALSGTSQTYSLIVTGGQNVEANPPPVVNITTPSDGVAVLPGSPVTITATATDMAVGGQPGQIASVEFFEGTNAIGQVNSPPYQVSWTPSASGVRVLTARATDNENASSVSSPVNVTVLVGDGSPTISSFSPSGGVAGDTVTINGNNLGNVSSVRFGSQAAAFVTNSITQIAATVPSAAVTAPITVSNSYGSVTTTNNFSILPILFREDFSSITTGNNSSSGGSSTAWTGNTNFPTGLNDFQAGGAVRLGTSSAVGSITSRAINLSGNGGAFTISFKVKGWTTVEGQIKVTAGTQSQTVSYAATMSGEFETKTLNYTGGNSATTIKIETTAKRAYIDEITVTAEAPSSAPVITSPLTAGGIAGTAFSYQIAASNSPTSFGASNLPAWASVNTNSGLISGALPTAGTNVVSISASNSVGVASTNLTITILPSGGGGGGTNTIFSENMGAPSATTSIAANIFQNSGTLTFAGTGDVRTTTASSGYSGSSGNGNVFINNTANLFFEISGINTANHNNLALSLGHYKSTTASSNELAIEVSADGTNYSSLTYSRASGSGTAVWALVNPTGAIPSATNLRIRFRQTSTSPQFRIDDVKLTGVAAAVSPSISAVGTLAAVSTTYGTASTNPTSFTLSGSNLAAGITVAPPAGFQLSATNTNNFAGGGSSIVVGSGGTVANTTVFVRLAADAAVGTYSGNIICSSPGASDVTVATVASTVSRKPISVTADSVRKTYGASDPELTYTPSEVAPFSGDLVRDVGEAAGSYRIRQGSLTAGSNFVISFTEVDFAILKKRLSVTADNRTKSFGQTLTLGAGQTGFTTSEMGGTDKIDTVTITASGGTEANDPAGTYVLTPSAPVGQNFAIGNYDIYYTPGTLTVTGGSAMVTLSDWTTQNGLTGADAAPDADPDHDGVSNLMAYYMGLDPKGGQGLVGYGLKAVTDSSLSLTYRRSKGVTGVSAEVQATGDLSSSWGTSGVQESSVVNQGTYEEVTATVTSPPGSTKMFMRLRVTTP